MIIWPTLIRVVNCITVNYNSLESLPEALCTCIIFLTSLLFLYNFITFNLGDSEYSFFISSPQSFFTFIICFFAVYISAKLLHYYLLPTTGISQLPLSQTHAWRLRGPYWGRISCFYLCITAKWPARELRIESDCSTLLQCSFIYSICSLLNDTTPSQTQTSS